VINPYKTKDTPLHDLNVNRIIGPIFFDDTISSERYCEVIPYTFNGYLNDDENDGDRFQRDGAAAHTAHVSMTLLRDVFGDKIISKDIWPPRSPDLTPPIIICEG
jgi:hypothetical protein